MTLGGILAHGEVPPAPSAADVFLAWAFEPFVWVAVAAAAALYRAGIRRVPGWPRLRSGCFGAGLATLLLASSGPPAVYEGALFWVHMLQHLLLTLGAAPLLAFGAPVTLALRAAPPRARGSLATALHSRLARALGRPLVAWTAFGTALWATHLSGLYDAALENEAVHVLEHGLLFGTALLFWAPVAGVDPGPRLARPARVGYLLAALPVGSFLGLALYSADEPRYAHYATLARDWGPGALDDQRAAAMIMWLGGDALLLAWTGVAAAAWLRAEEDEARRVDHRLGAGREGAPPP